MKTNKCIIPVDTMEMITEIDAIVIKKWHSVCEYLGKSANECMENCEFYRTCKKLMKRLDKCPKRLYFLEKQLLMWWTLVCEDMNDCKKCPLYDACRNLRVKLWKKQELVKKQ